MRGTGALICLMALIAPCRPALPGPWPREPGTTYSAGQIDSNRFVSTWVEIGFRPGRWFSLQSDSPADGKPAEAALSFHQALPIWRGWVSAVEVGVTMRAPSPYPRTLDELRPKFGSQLGASIGRGLDWPLPGWVALSLRQRLGEGLRRRKAELVLGLRPRPKLELITELQYSAEEGLDPSLQLQAVGLWQITPALSLSLGLRQELTRSEARPVGLLGTAFRF